MKYRKRPVEIEAVQFTGENEQEIYDFCPIALPMEGGDILIKTLEGHMRANPGDWIIKGVRGEFYPCREDIFNETYDKVEDDL